MLIIVEKNKKLRYNVIKWYCELRRSEKSLRRCLYASIEKNIDLGETVMTELEKIEYTKGFIDKLANGINPIDDTPIPDGDIANNVRLSRCFFYVSEILGKVIENGGVTPAAPKPKVKKQGFVVTEEAQAALRVSQKALSVSEIAELLNSAIDTETTKTIAASKINKKLLELGFLQTVTKQNGKTRKLPTAEGESIGIFTEERTGQYGTFTYVLFSPAAQQFVIDNLSAFFDNDEKDKTADADSGLSGFYGRPWTEEHDQRLTDLFAKGASISEIASILRRTEHGIVARLKKRGFTK